MRRIGLALVLLLGVAANPATAGEVERGLKDGELVVRDSRPGHARDEAVQRVGTRPKRFYYRVAVWDEGKQQFCTGWRSTDEKDTADRQNENWARVRLGPTASEPCQQGATPAPELQVIAAQVWERVEDLPVPSLDIEPDHAVTGKKVYLQILGQSSWTKTIDNPIGDDIVISATSDYVVDWGDPTWGDKTVTRSQGGPWPDGDVTHVYTEIADRRTISVTQRWRATWRAGDRGGTLSQLTTQAPALDLEVRQLQAVRNR